MALSIGDAALFSAAARAQGRSTQEAAARYSTEAREAYEQGRFRDAVELYRKAYDLKRDPVLLFNMARCYEALATRTDLERSIENYEEYLRARPDASDRAAVERRVEVLRQQVRLLDDASKPRHAPPPAAAPVVVPAARPSAPPWIVAGVGASGVVVGAVLGGVAAAKRDDAAADPSGRSAQKLESSAQSLATGANVAFIAGGAVAAGGIAWGIVDLVSAPKPAARGAAVRIGPASLTVEGRF
jgi:tetratricopeptide (TPR) repeat protein